MNRFSSISPALTDPVRRLLILVVLAMPLGSPVVKAQPCAYVTDFGSQEIYRIDTGTNTAAVFVNTGFALSGIAITPDGSTAYIADDQCGVSIVDLTRPVNFFLHLDFGCGAGNGQHGIAITPDGSRTYVPLSSAVGVIDTATITFVTAIPIGSRNPPNIAITPNGALAYVTGADGSNNVTVINTSTNTVAGTFLTGVGPTTPYGIAFSANGARAYVTNNATEAMNVAVIDTTANNSLVTSIPLDGRPTGISITPDGNHLYALNGSFPTDVGTDMEVSVISTATNTVVNRIHLGGLAYEVGFTADGAHAYVPNYLFSNVAVIETATNTVVDTISIPAGVNPFGVAIRPVGSCPGPPTSIVSGQLTGNPKPSTFVFNPTPVPGGPAGTFSFAAHFCNTGGKQLTLLRSVTTSLTGGDVLLSARAFPTTQGFADGVLSPGECVDVPYVIGLAARKPFQFLVDVVGAAE